MSKPLSPQDRKRIVTALFAAQSLFSAASIAATTLTAIIAVHLSGSESTAGLPSTVLTFSRALFAFPLGMMMAQWGRRLGLSFAYFAGILAGIAGAVAIVHHTFAGFIGAMVLLGMARGGADQSRFTAAEVFPPEQRARIIGLIVSAGTIGAIGGPLIVDPANDWVHQQFGVDAYSGAWYAMSALTLLATLSVFLFMYPEPNDVAFIPPLPMDGEGVGGGVTSSDQGRPAPQVETKRTLREIFRDPNVQFGVTAMVISQTVMQVMMVITALHMKHHGHDTGEISLVITAHTLGMYGLSYFSGWMIDTLGRFNMILVGALILLASCLMAPLSNATLPLMIALFLVGLGWNLCYVGGSSLLSNALVAAERSTAQGFNEALVAFCAGVGTLVTGPIFEWGDYVAVSGAGLFLVLILTGMIGRYGVQENVQASAERVELKQGTVGD